MICKANIKFRIPYLVRSLSSEIWQFQPLSKPIFSEKTRERSSFSLLKWTKRIQARSSCSIKVTYKFILCIKLQDYHQFILNILNHTISVWAWYCIETIPIKIWLHCNSKQPSTVLTSSSFASLNSNESEINH